MTVLLWLLLINSCWLLIGSGVIAAAPEEYRMRLYEWAKRCPFGETFGWFILTATWPLVAYEYWFCKEEDTE